MKVLDFGLGEGAGSAPTRPRIASNSPTITIPRDDRGRHASWHGGLHESRTGHGQAADKRADIWAFGCVLYEMLTGHRAFAADDVADTLASVLRAEPEWSALPAAMPPALERLLRRCLHKDPKRRLRDIGDAMLDLDEAASFSGAPAVTVAQPRPRMWQRPVPALLLLMFVVAAAAAATWSRARLTDRPPSDVTRFALDLPLPASVIGSPGVAMALSPDGRTLVYVGAVDGREHLYRRPIDQLESTLIGGTEGGRTPFFSPDGEWLGFEADGALKKVAVAGGPAFEICRIPGNVLRGASWGVKGDIVFSGAVTGLLRVPSGGGEPQVLTTVDQAKGERQHIRPAFLPSGDAVLFVAWPGTIDKAQVELLKLDTGERRSLGQGSSPHFLRSGHIIFARLESLWAVRFDAQQFVVRGEPVPVLQGIFALSQNAPQLATAANGTLVYLQNSGEDRTLAWVDRHGREEPLSVPAKPYRIARLSPDGTRVALGVRDHAADIWVWDSGRLTRMTSDAAVDIEPVWSADGQRVWFASDRAGRELNVYSQAADGTGRAERLFESATHQVPISVTPNGAGLILEQSHTGKVDLHLRTLGPNPKSEPLLDSAFADERNGEVSPDGRWLAYQSNESGRDEVWVRPFPDVSGGRQQVSTDGGTRPAWARTGRELFYLSAAGTLTAVSVLPGPTLTFGAPTPLFTGNYFRRASGRSYDVSPDGQRFLMIKESVSDVSNLIVVLNWQEELKRLVPVN